MLTPPPGLGENLLAAELDRCWGLAMRSLAYQAVGWGSHHWKAADAAGGRWFVTADELETKRHRRDEPLSAAFARLCASLGAAIDVRDCGRAFVLAPVPTAAGEPAAAVSDRFGVAVYPFVDGQSFSWGEFGSPAHRDAVLTMIVALHTAPPAARRRAMADDLTVPHRDELDAAVEGSAAATDCGPYARPVARLLAGNAGPVRRLLGRYDELAALARSGPTAAVLTHGEPHPGNTMLTSDGWRLIDWDTALAGPPERDLWNLDPGDAAVLSAYRDETGVTPSPTMLELYRIRWDIADIAVDVSRFGRPHSGSADDEQSWRLLSSLVARIGEAWD